MGSNPGYLLKYFILEVTEKWTAKVKISLIKKFNFRMDFDHMFEEGILQLKTQMTMFTLVFINIFDSMYFGFMSFQNKSVAHFLTTFVTFDSSVNLMYMSFQKTWSSKTSGTLFTVKWGTFFMIFHHVFFQVATTWEFLVTKFTLVSIGFRWNWRSVGMHTPFFFEKKY